MFYQEHRGNQKNGSRVVLKCQFQIRLDYLMKFQKYQIYLELVIVNTEDQMRIWNELMICEHYKSAGRLVGRQIRYLIKSEHGWLGGISFSSAALQLEDRDNWIGWDKENRLKNLRPVPSK